MAAPERDIVVSGMSLRLPESDSADEFWENLVQGVDMVTEDGRRWPPGFKDLPPRNGKLKDLSKFDCGFFGITPKQADKMDPQLRILLEVSYEAVVESGHSLQSVRGSSTGVFIGSTFSDAHDLSTTDCDMITGYEMTGCNRAMLANRLSYVFDLKGPSMTVDTACSSGLECLCLAFSAIHQGRCDRAIVGAANLLLKPETSKQFQKLNMLSPEGRCKTFDDSADGYCRSEGVVAMVIERRASCRRHLLTIRSVLDNSDGYKPQGITFPSLDAQKDLLRKIYKKAKIDSSDVSYLEAHGTGTQAGDSTELSAVDEVLCQNRPQPLLVGSLKSNIGHTEATSGLASIAKIVLAHEHQILPGNLHYKNPNHKIPSLHNGHLEVVHTNTPWEGGIVGINSFGFGGANVHVIVETNGSKLSLTEPVASSAVKTTMPNLIVAASRTEESVRKIFNGIGQESSEKIHSIRGILNNMSQEALSSHSARGFTIPECEIAEVKEHLNSELPQLWYVYPGMGSQWPGMGKEMMAVPQFAEVIRKCHDALQQEKFDLISLLQNGGIDAYKNPLDSFVGICAIQIGLTEVLKGVGLRPDGILGHSVGELGCAFADETLTVEQTILAAYWRGYCVQEAKLPEGAMAAVGLTWEEAKSQCPDGVVPACHNSTNTVTVSGPKSPVQEFVDQLQSKGVFARLVNSSGIAFHSYFMQKCSQPLLKILKEVISQPKPRSEKWISTSVPVERSNENSSLWSSAEYHVNNLVSPVLFKEGLSHIPQKAVVIEIGPHSLLLPLIRRELGAGIVPVGTMKRNSDRNIALLLSSIGRCYTEGFNVDLSYLYGPNRYPVSPDTPLISSGLSWQHSETWHVPIYTDIHSSGTSSGSNTVVVDLANPEHIFLAGHTIDGRVLYPAAGYVCTAWEACAKEYGLDCNAMDVHMRNLKIHEAVILGEDAITFHTQYSRCTGHFEISVSSLLVCSANVKPHSKSMIAKPVAGADKKHTEEDIVLTMEDIYKYLRIRGYDYGDSFQCVKEYHLSTHSGQLKEFTNWVTHIDALLHIYLLEDQQDKDLMLPTALKQLIIRPKSLTVEKKAVDVCFKPCTKEVLSEMVQIKGVQFSSSTRRPSSVKPIHCAYNFMPYTGDATPLVNPKPNQPSTLVRGLTRMNRIHRQKSGSFTIPTNTPKGMYTSYLKQLQPLTKEHLPEPDDDGVLLKNCIDICLENNVSGNVVIGCIIQSLPGLELAKGLSSLMKFIAQVSLSVWVSSREPGLLEESDLPGMELYHKISDIPKSLTKSTNILIFDTPENNGILGGILPDTIIFFVSKESTFSIPKGYTKILQRASISSEVTVAQKQKSKGNNTHLIKVENGHFDWVEKVKRLMSSCKNSEHDRLWLVHSGKEPCGLIGLVNCLLHEPGGQIVRCLANSSLKGFSLSEKYKPGNPELDDIINKDLVMNIYRDGQWGSFRRKLLFEDTLMAEVPDAYMDIRVPGDVSSLQWIESDPKEFESSPDTDIVQVTHAALNFRDVMCATGRISTDALPGKSDVFLGLEFSGFDQNGVRKMGICNGKGFATKVRTPRYHTWITPSPWTLQEAASVPVAYATAYYSLVLRANITRGKRLLIHSACSAVGQAALNVALSIGCIIFVTAGTTKKREYLMKKFGIPPERVSNSRDLSFVDQFMEATDGEGIDVILNALAEDKLKASLDLLRQNGHFLEIGKFDLSQNTNLGMSVFLKNISFHGIQIETILEPNNPDWKVVHRLIEDGVSNNVVKPLDVALYAKGSVVAAFRYMSEGNHIGKIVVQIRNNLDILQLQNKPNATLCKIKAKRTLYFKSTVTYIITGGLGGLALEIVNWMVKKGARKFVLTSRSGIKTGYQRWMVHMWREKAVEVLISQCDVADYGETETLFNQANSLGPVGGIFHLAAVLHDALLEAQSPETFKTVAEVKVKGICHLDQLSRQRCGQALDLFVAFSSAASSYGNAGQSNYGYANSYMERVCEMRVADGYPAKALQWGFIGDVGIVQDQLSGNSLYHMGMVPQRIPSFLKSLEQFLLDDGVVYSSIQPAPKDGVRQKSMTKEDFSTQVTQSVFEILGVKNISRIQSNAPLIEMGLDSLMTTEIRQVLGRKFDLNLSVVEVQNLTLDNIRNYKN